MLKKAEKNPDFNILTFRNHQGHDHVLSYGAIVERGDRLAVELVNRGLDPGDVFACVMENCPMILIALYAASVTRTVVVSIDPNTGWECMAYVIRQSGAKGVIFDVDSADSMEKVREIQAEIEMIAICNANLANGMKYVNIRDYDKILPDEQQYPIPCGSFKPEDNWLVVSTSGTTGIPKLVCLPASRFSEYARIAKTIWKFQTCDCLYSGLPLLHISTLLTVLFPSLALSIPLIVDRSFSCRRIWDDCRKYGCTVIQASGYMLADIHATPRQSKERDNPVRLVIGSGTPQHLWRSFENRFDLKIHEWYCTTEGCFAHNPPGKGPIGSFGKAENELVEMKIVDNNQKECQSGEIGELLFRFKNDHHGFKLLKEGHCLDVGPKNGWLKTDDLAYQTKSGDLFFHSKKTLALGAAIQSIDFLKIESIINGHPDVEDVCVYHIARKANDSESKNGIIAAVIPRDFLDFDIGDVFDLCRSKLGCDQTPDRLQVVQSFPKTLTGKKAYRLLGDELDDENNNVFHVEDFV